ncbi:hypothetical protein K3495_g10619 [Podosphaera aphanis]|nr:hypothetical protein K3495_g10619 [Podosphaera aphanis]
MASSSEDDLMTNGIEEDGDLFGDDEEIDDASAPKKRELSDRELDSGDDEDRNDRIQQTVEEETGYESGTEARILEATLWRHPIPKPLDGELNTLRLPKFLGIEPCAYESENFVPPNSDHHSETRSANFSASSVALSTIRYRRDPKTGKLQSNTVLHKWSDGSTTIAIGDQHYELQTKHLAPPIDSKPYQEVQDSHTYLASPSIASQLILLIGHMNNQYIVGPNKDIEDDALEKLQKSLAAATRGGSKGDEKGGPELITNTEDPELQKKKAEIAEKERLRAQRRRETAAEKQSFIRAQIGGRGGLNIDDLEGRFERKAAGAERKATKPRRNRSSYDSDDEPRVGRSRQDEYDKEDDFLADSDEELEESAEEEEEEEDEIEQESDRDEPKAKKQKTSKVTEESDDGEADAEADLVDEDPPIPVGNDTAVRGRKRNIIEDDDDDDE